MDTFMYYVEPGAQEQRDVPTGWAHACSRKYSKKQGISTQWVMLRQL